MCVACGGLPEVSEMAGLGVHSRTFSGRWDWEGDRPNRGVCLSFLGHGTHRIIRRGVRVDVETLKNA